MAVPNEAGGPAFGAQNWNISSSSRLNSHSDISGRLGWLHPRLFPFARTTPRRCYRNRSTQLGKYVDYVVRGDFTARDISCNEAPRVAMTYGIKQVAGIVRVNGTKGAKTEGWFGTQKPLIGATWGSVANNLYLYLWGAHTGHALEFAVALACYFTLFADGWEDECKTVSAAWVGRVFAFNLSCEIIFVGFWHWFVYVSQYARGLLPHKFNPVNPYIKAPGDQVGLLTSPTGHLQREVFYTTLGWLQSASLQCVFMWAWASGRVPFYADFWAYPGYSLLYMHCITYWREIHFYWCHRGMHPWFDRKLGLANGDVGAFLYRHVHSLHHKSYNPGPWSGLSMHPVEHFLYYSCAWLPLLATAHPIHFLYCKFHADIAPIGGHDGYDEPSSNGDFHWLHHAYFECNYGVPFPIDFDKMFGTWVDYKDYKKSGSIKSAKALSDYKAEAEKSDVVKKIE